MVGSDQRRSESGQRARGGHTVGERCMSAEPVLGVSRATSIDADLAASVSTHIPDGCRITYISWAESCSRSDHTARELGGRSYMVCAAALGSRASTIIIKYALQWTRTLRILRRDCPDTVFVMTPPVVAALPAFWYAWRHNKQVVLD